MNLPAGTLAADGQQTVKVVCRLFRAVVRPDMAGLQTVSDGQQIHTERLAMVKPR
jgi:hypothetical protein